MVSNDPRTKDGGKKGTGGETERKGVDVEAPVSGLGPNGCGGGRRLEGFEGKDSWRTAVSIEYSGRCREPPGVMNWSCETLGEITKASLGAEGDAISDGS